MKFIRYIIVMCYTVALVGALSCLPLEESSAKYIKKDLKALNYGIRFKSLTSNYTRSEVLDSSDAYTLKYALSFKRKNNMEQNDTLDSYLVNIDNPYCKIDTVKINGNLTSISNNTISFQNLGEENVDIEINCDLQTMIDKNKLEVSMNTYGYFNDIKDYTYLFATDSFQISNIEDYYNQYGRPSEDSCVDGTKICRLLKSNDEEEMFDRLVTWIRKTTKINSPETDDVIKEFIITYLRSSSSSPNFEDKVNSENLSSFNTLNGLSTWQNDQYYVFEVDDYFGSYAITDYKYKSRISDTYPLDFYFYNEENIDSLFFEYVKKYLKPENISVVENYIKSKEQLNSVSNIIDLIKAKADYRLSNVTYDETEKRLTVPANLYQIITGEKLQFSLSKSDILPIRVLNFRINMNSYIDTQWTESILKDNNGYFANCLAKNDTNFDHYTYFKKGDEGLLLHVYARDTDTTKIFVEAQYINDLINLQYDMSPSSSNSNVNIKSDLDSIAQNIKNTNIVLIDNSGNVVNATDDNLLDGEYQSNIGVIKVSTESNQKIVSITF